MFSSPTQPAGMYQPPTSNKKRKLLIAVTAITVLLVGGSAAAYVGIIAPNKPENIWKVALDRTATVYDTLTTDSSQKFKDAHGVAVKGDYKIDGSLTTDGTMELQTYDGNAKFAFDAGLAGTRVNVEGRVIDAANSISPDVYVKASGIKGFSGLAGPDYGALLTQLDNKWIGMDHTIFDSFSSSVVESSPGQSLTSDELKEVTTAIGEVNREYLFTTNSNKAVLRIANNVGVEDQDGRSVYHYKVGLHKQHTKDYINALTERLEATPVKKILGDKKLSEAINKDELLKGIDEYKESDTADVYVDKSTKLIRTVRITDPKDSREYLEIKVPYTGGDDIPLVLTLATKPDSQSEPGTAIIDSSINKESGNAKLKLTYDFPPSADSGKREKGTAKMTMTINNAKLNLQKPADAISIAELLGGLMPGMTSTSAGVDDLLL